MQPRLKTFRVKVKIQYRVSRGAEQHHPAVGADESSEIISEVGCFGRNIVWFGHAVSDFDVKLVIMRQITQMSFQK